MPRIQVLVSSAVLLCVAQTGACQSPDPTLREWSDLSGKFSVKASISSWDAKNVTLEKASGDTVSVPRGRLGKDEQAFLEAWISIEDSKTQEPEVAKLVAGVQADPRIATASLVALHKSNEGLIAGLVGSSFLATSQKADDLEDAEKSLDETITRLRKVQKYFPTYHQTTMVSALNNSAVISLRQRRSSKAVSMLEQAVEVQDDLAFAVYHNLSLVLTIISDDPSDMGLSSGQRRKLEELLPAIPPTLSGLNVPKRYLYTWAYDASTPLAPPTTLPTDMLSALRALSLCPELTCFFCSGTGMKDCGACSRGVRSEKTRQLLGYNQLRQPIYGNKTVRVRCENCKGTAGFRCPACDNGRLPLQ